MSESKSSESLINTWAQTQQKLLTNWLDTIQRFSGTAGPELWTKTVEAWQTSVKQTLDAQEEWIRQWTGTLANTKEVAESGNRMGPPGKAVRLTGRTWSYGGDDHLAVRAGRLGKPQSPTKGRYHKETERTARRVLAPAAYS